MTHIIKEEDFFVFDLDDTLFKEIDFLKSAYVTIAEILEPQIGININSEMIGFYLKKESTFDIIKDKYQFSETVKDLVDIYRFHFPTIKLSEGVFDVFSTLKKSKNKIGLISDGRTITQTNKLVALEIYNFFDQIIISEAFGSEKPNFANYKYFEENYKGFNFYYFADNVRKDFITPNKLGWHTIGLRNNGKNIHVHNISDLDEIYLPKVWINSFKDLTLIIPQ